MLLSIGCSEAASPGSEAVAGNGASSSMPSSGGTAAGGSAAAGGNVAENGGTAGGAVAGNGGTAGGPATGGAATASVTAGGSTGAGAAGGMAAGGSDAGGSAAGGDGTQGSGGSGGAPSNAAPRVLVFSRTVEYRHASIPNGVQALTDLAAERGWTLSATEDPALFSDTGLEPFNVVVFLSTTGDVLDDAQQASFERFIRAGHGYVGIHSASDTEYDWAFYGGLVGAYFNAHPDIQPATIIVEDSSHPSTQHLSGSWMRTDEWYGFRTNPRSAVHVLLSLDESSYSPGEGAMDGDHPIAWYHEYEGGRAFYTALGHTAESYSEPRFLTHLAGAIEWAAE